MFDIGFSELLVIAVVALIVIGPERLPKVARTAGLLSGRLRRYVNDIKADISREMQLDELKKMQQDVADRIAAAESTVQHEMNKVEAAVTQKIAPPELGADNLAASPAPSFPNAVLTEKTSTEPTKTATPTERI
jgi:sec-independent protein translocase protein TatB